MALSDTLAGVQDCPNPVPAAWAKMLEARVATTCAAESGVDFSEEAGLLWIEAYVSEW